MNCRIVLEPRDMFSEGAFTDSKNHLLSVVKTVGWAASQTRPTPVPISDFIEALRNGDTDTLDKFGSKDWNERAGRADTAYPVLVMVDDHGEHYLGDGNHRVWRAHTEGKDTIHAYVVRESDVPVYCRVFADDGTSRGRM